MRDVSGITCTANRNDLVNSIMLLQKLGLLKRSTRSTYSAEVIMQIFVYHGVYYVKGGYLPRDGGGVEIVMSTILSAFMPNTLINGYYSIGKGDTLLEPAEAAAANLQAVLF